MARIGMGQMNVTGEVLRLVGQLAVRQITRRIREGRVSPSSKNRGRTLMKRGLLLRSIKNEARGTAVVISAGGADVPYARIHHEGGVILPNRAKYLAIPLTAKAALFKPRDYPGETFIAKGVIFEKVEGGKPMALYALKKRVEMPARPYMFLDENDKRVIEEAVSGYLQSKLRIEN